MKILFLAANPKSTSRLNLGQEVQEIEEGLKRSKLSDQFQLVPKWEVRPRDLRHALLEENPDIVHFSGHGKGSTGLVLVDNAGKPKPATGEALAGLFVEFPNIKCVLLNACYAEIQARSIVEHIDYVIGMQDTILDDAAISFSTGFYDGLGYGRNIEDAFALGRNAILWELASFSDTTRQMIPVDFPKTGDKGSLPENLKPILLKKSAYLNSQILPDNEVKIVNPASTSSDNAVEKYRVRVQEYLADRVLTLVDKFQLATLAKQLEISESAANDIAQAELQRFDRAKANLNRYQEEFTKPIGAEYPLQTWNDKRYDLINKLSCVLNKKLDNSLFIVNSFLLSSEFLEVFILDYPDLQEKLKELSIMPVTNQICPLVACSEWCRQRFNDHRDKQSFEPNIAKEIENLLNEIVKYREGVDANKIGDLVKDSFKKFKSLIQNEDLRLQIEIEPKVDEGNNTGLNNGLFSLNMNLWIASKNLPLGRFAENKELNLQADEQDSGEEMCDRLRASLEKEDFLSNLIRKARYSLPPPVKLKIEFFLPCELFQVALEKICFKFGSKIKNFGLEYPIFINSYERYFDPDYREIRDAIQFKKEDFWNDNSSFEPEEICFIGTQPSFDDLERIEEEFAIAVWNRCEDDFLIKDSDIEISEWKNLPQKICNLRKQNKDLNLTLFWDDLYPKPSEYTRPLNTDLVE